MGYPMKTDCDGTSPLVRYNQYSKTEKRYTRNAIHWAIEMILSLLLAAAQSGRRWNVATRFGEIIQNLIVAQMWILCRQGRHRAGLFNYCRGYWLSGLGFCVCLEHCALFLDARGPCGCGTPRGICSVYRREHRITNEENRAWVAGHQMWILDIAKEFSRAMNEACADQIEAVMTAMETHNSARPAQRREGAIRPAQELLAYQGRS